MKFSEMIDSKNDAELGAMMRDRFTRLMDAHSQGLTDTHPSAQYNSDTAVLRAHRAAKDASGSGLGARELEETDQPGAQDDPPPTSGSAGVPQRGAPTLDAAIPGYGRLLHGNRDTRVVDADGIVQSVRSW